MHLCDLAGNPREDLIFDLALSASLEVGGAPCLRISDLDLCTPCSALSNVHSPKASCHALPGPLVLLYAEIPSKHGTAFFFFPNICLCTVL